MGKGTGKQRAATHNEMNSPMRRGVGEDVWKTTHLAGYECGFGYFVGDIVQHPTKPVTGRVICIFRVSRCISIAWGEGEVLGTYHPAKAKLEIVGRVVSTMFPKDILTWLYKKYDLSERVFFWYHFKGCGRKAAESVAEKFNISIDEMRTLLIPYKSQRLI